MLEGKDEKGNTSFTPCNPVDATHVWLQFPSPPVPDTMSHLLLPVSRDPKIGPRRPQWHWNADCQRPTLKPSIRSQSGEDMNHCYVTDGEVKFLHDCTHAGKGQTMSMAEVKT